MRIGEAVQTDGEEKGAQISFLFPSVRRSSTEGNRSARYRREANWAAEILTETGIKIKSKANGLAHCRLREAAISLTANHIVNLYNEPAERCTIIKIQAFNVNM